MPYCGKILTYPQFRPSKVTALTSKLGAINAYAVPVDMDIFSGAFVLPEKDLYVR
jgi:hypothetical protein